MRRLIDLSVERPESVRCTAMAQSTDKFDAGKLHQRPVSHEFDDAALVGRHLGRERILAQGLERRQGAGLVRAHETRIVGHVRRYGRGQSAIDVFPCHGLASMRVTTALSVGRLRELIVLTLQSVERLD